MKATSAVTATITAVGCVCSPADHEEAVDADIYVAGERVGEVTLIPDHVGRLDSWGDSTDPWASRELLRFLGAVEDASGDYGDVLEAMADIIAAVNRAAARAYSSA